MLVTGDHHQKSDGTEVGSFTVNQSAYIALPADVVPSAPGDGQLTIKDGDGNELGVFTQTATGNDTEAEPAVIGAATAAQGALADSACSPVMTSAS